MACKYRRTDMGILPKNSIIWYDLCALSENAIFAAISNIQILSQVVTDHRYQKVQIHFYRCEGEALSIYI